MVEQHEQVVLDVEKARIRKANDVHVQTIPKRWLNRRDLQGFFESDLEIALVREDDQTLMIVRTVPRSEKH
jgi:hypothetical protein